jgi:hypothetical protein
MELREERQTVRDDHGSEAGWRRLAQAGTGGRRLAQALWGESVKPTP